MNRFAATRETDTYIYDENMAMSSNEKQLIQ